MKSFIRIMIIFMGIVLGSYLGELALQVPFLKFLSYGKELGLTEPLVLNLGFINVTFGFMCKLNLASILGFVVSLFLVRKVVK